MKTRDSVVGRRDCTARKEKGNTMAQQGKGRGGLYCGEGRRETDSNRGWVVAIDGSSNRGRGKQRRKLREVGGQ